MAFFSGFLASCSGLKIRYEASNDKDLEKRLHRSLHFQADLAEIADALVGLPKNERAAVAAHVKALAGLSCKRRAAIITLTTTDA